jgi:hypothetical protein
LSIASGVGTDQLHLVFVQHAVAPQIERAVQRSLATHGGQMASGRSLAIIFSTLPCNRFDVGHIGRGRVGHDRSGVAIDQDHFVAFFTQGLAGLYARVIELAGLPNDNGASADDEDGFECRYVLAFLLLFTWD